ncbi:11922_t:CDS:2, partial [Racocetra fulgida]
ESDTHFEDSSAKYEKSQLTARVKNSSGFFVPVDSASISSGTEFMQAANDAIRYYIYQRLNGRLKNLQIMLDDSSVAGEGEHKLFRFLTAQRNHPGYNTKYRHVVCGCDADFIMYALLTHEPNLRILRPGLKGNDVILNINRLRKHIIRDMVVQVTSDIKEDNIIDDFVCIANLLGNDFIPRIKYTPIRPFEQLMCILPPKCNYLVPEPFRPLFTDPQSPIYEFFPKKFKISNNKAILPFVDEARLMQAMAPGYALLKKEDIERNSINGRVHIYAGCQSSTYATLFPLCTSKGGRSAFPVTSVVFGQLSYCGPMLKFIKAPVDEFNKINHNLVATAEYQLP